MIWRGLPLLALFGAAASEDCLNADNFLNAQYTVKLQLGTPPQTLKVVPDTGSFELLVPTTACAETCQGNHTLFDPARSSTFRTFMKGKMLAYGQGQVLADGLRDRHAARGRRSPLACVSQRRQPKVRAAPQLSFLHRQPLWPSARSPTP